MKRLLALFFVLFVFVAFGADVTFNLNDFLTTTDTLKKKTVLIEPQSTPRTNTGSLIIVSEKRYFNLGTNGTFTATNMLYGNYLVSVWGLTATSQFRILVPDTSDSTNAVNLLVTTNSVPSESAGYTQSGADARFVNVNSDWASNLVVTNLVLRGSTNAFTFTNGAVAGYVLTTDGTGWYAAASSSGGVASNAIANLSGIGTNVTIFGNLFVTGEGSITISNSGWRRRAAFFDSNQRLMPMTNPVVTDDQLSYLGNLTSDIQTQLNARQPSSATLTNLSGTGAITNLNAGSVFYVATNGNDATAVMGRPDKPWLNLSNALYNVVDNSKVVIGPGTYSFTAISNNPGVNATINYPLSIVGKTNVLIEGSGPGTVIAGTGDGDLFGIRNCTNVTVRDFSIRRPQFPNTGKVAYSYTLGLNGTNQYIVIEDITLDGAPDHGIAGDTDYGYHDFVVIRNNRIFNVGATNMFSVSNPRCDGAGIQIGGKNWLVYGNYMTNVHRGIELYHGGSGVSLSGTVVMNNSIKNFVHEGITTVGGTDTPYTGEEATGMIIAYNDIDGCDYDDDRAGASNISGSGGIAGINLDSYRGHRVIGNRIARVTAQQSVATNSANGNGMGIHLSSSTAARIALDILIADNVIEGCKSFGIWQEGTAGVSNLVIRGNTILSNGQDGIRIQGPIGMIENNVIRDNAQGGASNPYGINLSNGAADNNVIRNNYLYNSAGGSAQSTAIRITGDTNIVYGNRIDNTTTPYSDTGNMNNVDSLIHATFIAGANITLSTNSAHSGIVTITGSAGGSGEVNNNRDASLTNATTIGVFHSYDATTNYLRTLRAGPNTALTNEGTNIVIAGSASPAFSSVTIGGTNVVENIANLTGATNGLNTGVANLNGATNGYLTTLAAYQTNSVWLQRDKSFVMVDATLRGTNQWWTTNLVGNLSVVLNEIREGVPYTLVVSNPATYTVTFDLDADDWPEHPDTAPTATTNGWSIFTILRTGTKTNAWMRGRDLELVAGTGIAFHTNSTSITISNTQSAVSGEANQNRDASLTNATTIGIFHSYDSTTNYLRTLRAGLNTVLTNEGTNVVIAGSASPAFSSVTIGGTNVEQNIANLTAATNALNTARLSSTNQVRDASLTNATTVGVFHSFDATTNYLRTLRAGYNMTLTNEGTNVVIAGAARSGLRRYLSIDAGAMVPESTDGATAATIHTTDPAIQRASDFLLFNDSSTNGAQFSFSLVNWDLGTVKFKLYQSCTNVTALSTNVFAISGVALGPNESITNVAWGTAVYMTNFITSTNTVLQYGPSPAMTFGNTPTTNDMLWIRIQRQSANANDNLGGNTYLKQVVMEYTEGSVEPPAW